MISISTSSSTNLHNKVFNFSTNLQTFIYFSEKLFNKLIFVSAALSEQIYSSKNCLRSMFLYDLNTFLYCKNIQTDIAFNNKVCCTMYIHCVAFQEPSAYKFNIFLNWNCIIGSYGVYSEL